MKKRREASAGSMWVSRTKAHVWIALALATSLTLSACEAPGVVHPLAAQDADNDTANPGSPTPTLPATQNQETPTPISTPTPEPILDTVQVGLKDFFLDPDELTAKAGDITFVLSNEGRYTHDFRVEGQGVDITAPKVGRGRTREWQITLSPGIYEISCPISNHADRGMVGTLRVVS